MITFRDSEKVHEVYRRHRFILVLEVMPIALFALVTIAGAVFGISQLSDESVPLAPLAALGALILLHVLWIALFIVLADFYLDVWILTDERLIAVEQQGLFSRVISEFELSKVQDMTVDVHGMLPTFLNYGNLSIRTASEHQNFVFKQIWHPHKVKDEITKAQFAHEKIHHHSLHDTPSI